MKITISAMKKEDILTKAMAIAKRNGFDISDSFFVDIPADFWTVNNQDFYFSLIFDHGFAKCFWGDNTFIEFFDGKKEVVVDLVESNNPIAALILFNKKGKLQIPSWQFHLLQMALSKDPIEYLRVFIEAAEFSKEHEQ